MRPGVAAELLGFEWREERAVDDFVFMRVTPNRARVRG